MGTRRKKFSLEKKTKKTAVSHSAWEEEDDDGEEETIDEDALLTEKDKAKPTTAEGGEGVGCPPTRKPVQRLHLRKERGRGDEGKQRNSSEELCREDGFRERPERRDV